jgi:hypothetical protein
MDRDGGSEMAEDRREAGAYYWAVAMLGLALVVMVAGLCWVAAERRRIPVELWFLAGALGGLFAGVLIPFRFTVWDPDANDGMGKFGKDWYSLGGAALVAAACGVALFLGLNHELRGLEVAATALGAVLIGLPIRSPGRVAA